MFKEWRFTAPATIVAISIALCIGMIAVTVAVHILGSPCPKLQLMGYVLNYEACPSKHPP